MSSYFYAPLLVILVFGLSSCSTVPQSTSGYVVEFQTVLPKSLAETSGLTCRNDEVLTINDSGNAPVVYSISQNGKFVEEKFRLGQNVDWESISVDSNAIYIADIGNNGGKRTDLNIQVVESNKLVRTLSISYEKNDPSQNVGYAHNFDAEAITVKNDSIILFSKSWSSPNTYIYSIDKISPSQSLTPINTISGLPGMITGADWDSHSKKYVVVGYESHGIGLMTPFVAVLDEQFNVESTEPLTGFDKVEAVCVRNGAVWFTQEHLPLSVAKLVGIRFVDPKILRKKSNE